MTMQLKDHWTRKEIELKDEIDHFRHAFRNGGRTVDGGMLGVMDAISTPNAPLMFKRAVTEVIQEAMEPLLIGTSLLSRIDYSGYGTSITFGTVGAIEGGLDMAEGQEYPEFSLQVGGGTVTTNIGKAGLAVKVTEEMIRYSQWDVINMHLRAAGRALARHKEEKIFNMLLNQGVVIFDNDNPASAEIGRTSGRGLDGTGNGSMNMDDLFDMYAKTLERGFTPNVVLVHPLTWATWAKDPVLREFSLSKGGGDWYNMPNGRLAPSTPWQNVPGAKFSGPTAYGATKEEREGTQTSTPSIPTIFPFGGLTIVPSAMVPFDTTTKTTSIVMMDTTETGAIIVDEDPTSDEWNDLARDIYKIKLRERYGLTVFHEGLAVSVARGISIEPNEIVLPPQATISGLTAITRK